MRIPLLGPMSPVWRGGLGPRPGSSRPVSSSQRPLLAGDVRVRTIRILAGGELARVHREDAVVVPDGVDRFREEVHLVVDDHSNDEGADVDVADPLLIPTVIRIFDAV